MPPFTQKYTLVQLFEGLPEGTQFSMNDWPLHSTIVDVFAVAWDVPTMIGRLTALLSNHEQASSVATEDTFFGPEKETRVALIEKTPSLLKLHNDVVTLLEQGGLKLNDPQYAREGFLPHSTVQKHARLCKGDILTFDALTLIDMFPGGDPYQRKIVKTIRIGHSQVGDVVHDVI